jgi:hypothetical protein
MVSHSGISDVDEAASTNSGSSSISLSPIDWHELLVIKDGFPPMNTRNFAILIAPEPDFYEFTCRLVKCFHMCCGLFVLISDFGFFHAERNGQSRYYPNIPGTGGPWV